MDGNKNQGTGDLLGVFMASINKSLEKTHVADVCKVLSVNNSYAKVQPINQPDINTYAYVPETISILAEDIVLVIYTDLDTRNNFKHINDEKFVEENSDKVRHSMDNGIVIMKIKNKEN